MSLDSSSSFDAAGDAFHRRGPQYLRMLSCPLDGAPLTRGNGDVVCLEDDGHRYPFEHGILRLIGADQRAALDARERGDGFPRIKLFELQKRALVNNPADQREYVKRLVRIGWDKPAVRAGRLFRREGLDAGGPAAAVAREEREVFPSPCDGVLFAGGQRIAEPGHRAVHARAAEGCEIHCFADHVFNRIGPADADS